MRRIISYFSFIVATLWCSLLFGENLPSSPTKPADPNITVEWLTEENWGCGYDNIDVTLNSDGTFECMGCVDGTGTWRIEETNIIFTLVESDGYKEYFDEPFPVDFIRKKIGELTRNDVTTQQISTTETEDIPTFTPYTSVPDDLDWIYGYWKSGLAGDLADVSRDGTIKYANAIQSGDWDVSPDYAALEKKSFVIGKYHYDFDNKDYMALSINNGENYLLIDPNNKALFYFYDFDYPNRFEKISDITYAETLIQEQKEALKAKILNIVSIVVKVLLLIGLLLLLWWGIKKLIVYAKAKKEATLAAVAQAKEKARLLAEQVKEQAVKSKDKIATYNNTQSEYGWLKATKWMIITSVVILLFIDILIGLILLTLSILLRKHLKESPEFAQNIISKISLNPTKYIMWGGILIGFIIYQLINSVAGLFILIASICYSFVSKKHLESVHWIYKRINQFISCICNSYKDRCLILAIGTLLLIINQLFSGLITILAIILFVLFLIAIFKNRNFHIVEKTHNYYIKFRESAFTARLGNWWQNKAVRICSIGLSIILVFIFTTNFSVLSVGKTLATPYAEDYCYSEVEDDVQSEPSRNKQNDNKPGWMYGSWRTPLDNDGGVLIVYLDYNYASLTIMDGFREVSKIKYDGWAIVGDLVFLGNDGDKLKDAPYLKIDHNRQLLLTATNQYMEKH